MAGVVATDHAPQSSNDLVAMTVPAAPKIEMVANPDFSFPMQPPSRKGSGDEPSKRPASMHINLPPTQSALGSHRRAASTLPSFTFNATDASGRQDTQVTPPRTPEETSPTSPSRRGHRRGGSEFVGGDSRFGVSSAVSSSPTKANALPVPASGPPTGGRRGHAHRRSAAISSHDVGSIMQPSEAQPRLSSSMPNTPLDHPAVEPEEAPALNRSKSSPDTADAPDPFGPPLEDVSARPPSRPRVGFSDNVEIIPRPLSTISSDTGSSMSTVRGMHSHTGSINSIISLGTPSPPSSRTPRTLANLNAENEEPAASRAKSSLEISRRLENEGEWLKGRSSGSLKRPYSESSMAAPKTTFAVPGPSDRARNIHNKKHSLSHALGFDRRRSEPTIGMNARESSRLSAISLQEAISGTKAMADDEEHRDHDHVSSARRLKQWAKSKVSGRTKEVNKDAGTNTRSGMKRPVSEGGISLRAPSAEPPVAETDLDAVFSNPDSIEEPLQSPSEHFAEMQTPTLSQQRSFPPRDYDEVYSPMLDLDAALGPFNTPSVGAHRPRKELHSNRQLKDFTGPGGHYHRRAESAPNLPPFEGGLGTPPQQPMADVFEEDEPDEEEVVLPPRAASVRSGMEDEAGMGVEIVDSDNSGHDSLTSSGVDDGLGITREEWEPERPTTGYGNVTSRFSGLSSEPRGNSVIEETIVEEGSSGEPVEIVEAHEEPRASSLTKSSDSSETPTIVSGPTGILTLPNGQSTVMTPDTYQTSAFSSPDFTRRQGSFEHSRLGTSASSLTDNRTTSSCNTGDHTHDLRVSVDDVPSLTSSRSTMLSTSHANTSRPNINTARTPSGSSGAPDPRPSPDRRNKRGSIQSLSQLVGGSFGSKSRGGGDEARPYTAVEVPASDTPRKKENRLKKLMFWKSKHGLRRASQPEGRRYQGERVS